MWSKGPGPEGHVVGRPACWPVRSGGGVFLISALLFCVLWGAGGAGSARADSLSAPYAILPPPPNPYEGAAASAVSCPSATQCTAVSDYGTNDQGQEYPGDEVTFDPTTETPNAAGIKPVDPDYDLLGVSCPSAAQCTAIDGNGGEVTFDPTTGQPNAAGVVSVVPMSDGSFSGVSCPSMTQCTAVYAVGEVTFDPTTGKPNSAGNNQIGLNLGLSSVSCPSLSQCTAVDGRGNSGDEVTFDPTTGAENATGHKHIVVGYGDLSAVSCPSTTQCTALDGLEEVTFDPITGTPNAAGTAPLAAGGFTGSLSGLACHSSTQCTAVGGHGTSSNIQGVVVSFDPAAPAGASPVIDPATSTPEAENSPLNGVACTSASPCVAVASGGVAVNITPSIAGGGAGSGKASVGSVKTSGSTAKVAVSCATGGATCTLELQVAVTETLRGNKVIALTARKTKTTKKTVVIGSAGVTLGAGQKKTVKVSLGGTGKKLLTKHHSLKTMLTVTNSKAKTKTVATKTVTFKAKKH